MKSLLLAAIASLLAVPFLAAEETQGPDKQASYIIGYQLGNNIRRDKAPVDIDEILRGMRTAMADEPLGIEPEQANAIMAAFGQRIAESQQKESRVFLDEFAKGEGVTKTESGLMYQVVKSGEGESPKASDKVRVHYRGTLTNGEEFDSSYSRGEPTEFQVGQVIQGWQEALQLMKPGDQWKLVIPSDLAYGPRGAGGMIGPNETLVFDVELLEIVK